ncbi:hypothetical protein CEXT_669311 [Caerostris extrusa]|uniref:Uncharacterized protein n=1 Tax=Caerostris extrusa TaxID=172846 RepID=A0AAV4RRH9_CAEEX|nr:hypothetical protein CEXT_669311 [Caerostris extrusa]
MVIPGVLPPLPLDLREGVNESSSLPCPPPPAFFIRIFIPFWGARGIFKGPEEVGIGNAINYTRKGILLKTEFLLVLEPFGFLLCELAPSLSVSFETSLNFILKIVLKMEKNLYSNSIQGM